MSDSAYDLTTGTVLDGRYQIVREIGVGGMSTVYLAEHALIGRRVAVKVLHAEVARSAESVARFMAEARTVGTLGHPNVIASTDMGHLPDGRPYLILEYLEGWTLAEELESVGRLPFQRAVHIAMQIASGVGAAHGRGIVHRDLKSDNVFLTQSEHAADEVKILDFGISKFLESPLETGQTQRGIILGTPDFMAPEQIHSPELVDHRADIYALGTILYHMLTGRTPFENTPAPKLWNRILNESPRPIGSPDVPGPLGEIIQRLLAKDPADRPQSMVDVFDALLPFAYPPGSDRLSSPTNVRPPSFFPRPRPLPLEPGHATPLPAPMTITQAEHTNESHASLAVAEARPRLTSPRGGLPAPGPVRVPSPRPDGTPPVASVPAYQSRQTPLRDSHAVPRRPGPPATALRARTGVARRRGWLVASILVLLAAGAGVGVWLVLGLIGSRAAAPEVATGDALPPVTVNVGAPEARAQEPADGPAVAPGEGMADVVVEANSGTGSDTGPGTSPDTATNTPPTTPPTTLDDRPEAGSEAAGQDTRVAAAGDAQDPEVAEDDGEERHDRRRRRRERRRGSSSSRQDAAREKAAAGAGEDGRPSAQSPVQGRVTPGSGETSPPVIEKTTPRQTPPAPEAGRVDSEATRRVVRSHLGEIRTCHERGRMDDPDLSGRVVVRITIGRGGKVVSTAIASSTLSSPSVEKCITSAVQKWTFPAPGGTGTAVIEYPFVLR
jgi:serine/threonine protein kinase